MDVYNHESNLKISLWIVYSPFKGEDRRWG
jgi:hypothetical protein